MQIKNEAMPDRSRWENGHSVGRQWQLHVGLAVFALLLFIYAIPHTISLRYLLLLGAAVLFGYWAVSRWNQTVLSRLAVPAVLFVTLSFWIVVGAIFVSPDPAVSLAEVRGQWLIALISLMAGVAAGIAVYGNESWQWLLAVVIATLSVHVLLIDAQSLWSAISSNSFAGRAQGLTEGPDKASFLTNMLLVFLLSELFLRLIGQPRALKITNGMFTTLLVLTLFSLYAEGTRNAVVSFLAMAIVFFVLYLIRSRKDQPQWRYTAAAIFCGFALLVSSLFYATASKREYTWDQMLATIPVALDTEGHKNWLDIDKYGTPPLANGGVAEVSTYLRIAWLKEGLLLVVEHPLGIGFDRNAFGRGLQLKYGEGRGHSHSGFIDIAIGTGVPGVYLWVAFLASLVWLGLRGFLVDGTYAALALVLLVLDFSTRLLLDSVNRDHMLQQFLLIAGLLAVATVASGRHDISAVGQGGAHGPKRPTGFRHATQ